MKLPTAQEMQALDRCAIKDFGIPGVVLMENAGSGTVRMMERQLGPCINTFACILVGPGNNGGDGLVIGRHLYQLGCRPFFFLLVHPDKLTGDAAVNMNIIKNLKLPFHVIDSEVRVSTVPVLFKQIESQGLPCYAIVDAIFGIGLKREVEGHFAAAIETVNRRNFAHGVPVVAVDCPSGMDADTGKSMGICLKADFTATYGLAKPGHYLHDSRELTGKLEVIEIGIPLEAQERISISCELLDQGLIEHLTPVLRRKHSSHKGDHGHLLIAAGSTGKTGAAILSARGALRSGGGLVSLLIPHALNSIMESSLWEAMTIPLPKSDYMFTAADADTALKLAEGKQAAVIGPGIGTDTETADFTRKLYHKLPIPLVVDADALNILALNPKDIQKAEGLRIFTPHPGELSRLLGWSTTEIQENRLEAARQACARFNSSGSKHIIILKGAGTIVCQPGRRLMINTSGNPGMATGGMGDVLSGIIGSLLCQGCEPFEAAAAGVYLHGAAADSLYRNVRVGYTASEVADAVPATLKTLLARDDRFSRNRRSTDPDNE
ncbi:bifunctional ADP-dependent NAD(P)H-hydrate dehydratase/NAD(P)H-hydrate epimerase [Desulfopila aestuarii]|uniref:Bifunctional NAD(P)H-hydrate repair enzyme n=1 Tax=Desulfopila aestuarii DSM 18488 TaxID=1121416 RepID=A0A1M7Y3V9_9BACT|nr:bifunctional ADP-dependent NAD(P)H-hydrate dehydratase/NAD(P)H-hydrate epimerase [Desulfopila aestuarii]SHO46913.1 NAD(P)H-hydrate epimerase [Desulfopila aestuarii DSM 18488]